MASKELRAEKKRLNSMDECPRCGKKMKKKSILQHVQAKHDHIRYECDTCHKEFTSNRNLLKHSKFHTGDPKPFATKLAIHVCRRCKKRLATNDELEKHLESLIVKNPFECQDCENEYRHKYRSCMDKQVKSHNADDPYECTVCRERFTSYQDWKRHLRYAVKHSRHAVKETPKCCVICEQAYGYTRPSLKEEERVHPGKNPFKCSTCLTSFRTLPGLNMHMSSLHEWKIRLSCSYCRKVFKMGQLGPHMLNHASSEEESREESDDGFDVRNFKLRRVACRHSETERR